MVGMSHVRSNVAFITYGAFSLAVAQLFREWRDVVVDNRLVFGGFGKAHQNYFGVSIGCLLNVEFFGSVGERGLDGGIAVILIVW